MPRRPKQHLSFIFPHRSPTCTFLPSSRATCPSHLILLYFITPITFSDQYTSRSLSLRRFIHTYSMVQSPSWEANWFAASQEIPSISRNPNVHYRTHKHPPPVSILGQPNPVHIPTSHLLEIHPSTPRSSFPPVSPPRPYTPPLLTHTRHMPSPSHSSQFYHPHNTGWGVQII